MKGKKGHIISSCTIRCTRRYLSEPFEYAVNIGLLKNPIELTKPPRLITTEIHTLSLDKIHQLTSTMKQQVSNNNPRLIELIITHPISQQKLP